MLGLGLGINKYRQSGGFDPNYQVILDYAVANAIALPSNERQIAENQLILDLKSIGLWNRLSVFYMFMGAPNEAYSRINWKNPSSHYITLNNTPTWNTATGWTTIAASSSNLSLNWNIASISDLQSFSVGSYLTSGANIVSNHPGSTFRVSTSSSFHYYRLGSLSTASAPQAVSLPNHFVVDRSGSAINLYQSGVSIFTGSNALVNSESDNVQIGRFNATVSGIVIGYFFGASSTDDIVTSINTTLSNYITAL